MFLHTSRNISSNVGVHNYLFWCWRLWLTNKIWCIGYLLCLDRFFRYYVFPEMGAKTFSFDFFLIITWWFWILRFFFIITCYLFLFIWCFWIIAHWKVYLSIIKLYYKGLLCFSWKSSFHCNFQVFFLQIYTYSSQILFIWACNDQVIYIGDVYDWPPVEYTFIDI